MSGREIDAVLEERLNDIDEFIQSELGHSTVRITEPFDAPEIHNLSSMLEKEGTLSGLRSNTLLAIGECTPCLSHVSLILWSTVFLVQNEG